MYSYLYREEAAGRQRGIERNALDQFISLWEGGCFWEQNLTNLNLHERDRVLEGGREGAYFDLGVCDCDGVWMLMQCTARIPD